MVVDVAHDARGAAVLAGGEHPEPGHRDHAWESIRQRGAAGIVGIDATEWQGDIGEERRTATYLGFVHQLDTALNTIKTGIL